MVRRVVQLSSISLRLRFSFKAYRRPFRVPVRTSRRVWEAREGILLRVDTEDGRTGFGEIAPIEWFGTETFAGALAWCAAMDRQPSLERLGGVPHGLPCCAWAVRAALEAIDGMRPVAADARLDVACLLPTGAAAHDSMLRARDAGFTTFKLKIGAASFEAECGMVERMAARLPEGQRLRLDANGGLDLRTAVRWLDVAEDWPVEFIEQPLPVEADRELVALARDHAVPIALDESVRGADDIRRWRDRGWPGLFVVKPALAGAADTWMPEVGVAPDAFVFSSALETAIGAAAGLRLAFVSGAKRALGYGVAAFFEVDDGLGGGWPRPTCTGADVAAMIPEDVWNRL